MKIHDEGRTVELTLDLSTVHLINLGKGMDQRTIRCVSGTVWVTQAGDSRDHILAEGHSLVVESPDVVVIQAFSPAIVRVMPTPDRPAVAA